MRYEHYILASWLKFTVTVVSTSTGLPLSTYGLYRHCFTAFLGITAVSLEAPHTSQRNLFLFIVGLG
jgi:hypothetical protein